MGHGDVWMSGTETTGFAAKILNWQSRKLDFELKDAEGNKTGGYKSQSSCLPTLTMPRTDFFDAGGNLVGSVAYHKKCCKKPEKRSSRCFTQEIIWDIMNARVIRLTISPEVPVSANPLLQNLGLSARMKSSNSPTGELKLLTHDFLSIGSFATVHFLTSKCVCLLPMVLPV